MRTDLELALTLAQLASLISLPAAGRCASWTKPDGSPVTATDLAVEHAMMEQLARRRPYDGVLGEETGAAEGSTGRSWILDPIDGTAAFVSGGHAWGTHVAVADRGRVVVAVVTRPTERRCWWAAAGAGTYRADLAAPFRAPVRLHVSDVDRLSRSRIGGLLPPGTAPVAGLGASVGWVDNHPDPIPALLEAELDAVVDVGGEPWDLAPPALLVSEAGGRFQDPAGGTRIDLGGALYTNTRLHEEVVALLAGTAGFVSSMDRS